MCFFDPLVHLHVCSAIGVKNRAKDGHMVDNFSCTGLTCSVENGRFLQGLEGGCKGEMCMTMMAFRGLSGGPKILGFGLGRVGAVLHAAKYAAPESNV